jgi:hypothetical protein
MRGSGAAIQGGCDHGLRDGGDRWIDFLEGVVGRWVASSRTAPARPSRPGLGANQPPASNDGAIAVAPAMSNRRWVARMPYTPHSAAGTRTDPAVSLPRAKSQAPAAQAAAEPLEEPPGRRRAARGLTGVP